MTYLNDNRSPAEHNRIILGQLAAMGATLEQLNYRPCQCCGKYYRGRSTQMYCSDKCSSNYKMYGGQKPPKDPEAATSKRGRPKTAKPKKEKRVKVERYDYDCGFDDIGFDDDYGW